MPGSLPSSCPRRLRARFPSRAGTPASARGEQGATAGAEGAAGPPPPRPRLPPRRGAGVRRADAPRPPRCRGARRAGAQAPAARPAGRALGDGRGASTGPAHPVAVTGGRRQHRAGALPAPAGPSPPRASCSSEQCRTGPAAPRSMRWTLPAAASGTALRPAAGQRGRCAACRRARSVAARAEILFSRRRLQARGHRGGQPACRPAQQHACHPPPRWRRPGRGPAAGRFVLVSTDKAEAPCGAIGRRATRLAELLVQGRRRGGRR